MSQENKDIWEIIDQDLEQKKNPTGGASRLPKTDREWWVSASIVHLNKEDLFVSLDLWAGRRLAASLAKNEGKMTDQQWSAAGLLVKKYLSKLPPEVPA